jgi:hypothetical protein
MRPNLFPMLIIGATLYVLTPARSVAQDPNFLKSIEHSINAPTSLQRARLEVTKAYGDLPSGEARAQALFDMLGTRFSDAEDVARTRDILLGDMPGMDRFRALWNGLATAGEALPIAFPDLDPEPLARLGRLAELRAEVTLQQGLVRSIASIPGDQLSEQGITAALSPLRAARTPEAAEHLLDGLIRENILVAEPDRKRLSKAIADRVELYQNARNLLQQKRAQMAARSRVAQQGFIDAVRPVQIALANNQERLKAAAVVLDEAWSRLQLARPGDAAAAQRDYATAGAEHTKLAEQARLGGEFLRQALLGSNLGGRIAVVANAVGDVADAVRTATVAVENAHADLKIQISAYAGAIGQIGDSMHRIGLISDAAAKAITAATGVAKAATSVVNSVASGNFIGAAMGVVGFLGGSLFGGGPSQEQIWHEEIMSGQRQILSGINEVIEGLQSIAQGVQELLKGQQKILEVLAGIADQIDRNQHELVEKLNAVEDRIVDVQFLLSNMALNNLRACETINDQLGSKLDLNALRQAISPASIPPTTINACTNGIRDDLQNLDVTTPGAPIPPIYLLNANPNPGLAEAAARESQARMRQVLSFFEQNTSAAVRAGIVRKLFSPSAYVQDLVASDQSPPEYALHISLGAPLSDQAILLTAHAALDVHWLFELLAPDNSIPADLPPIPDYSPISAPGTANDGFSKYIGLHALQKALPLVELAIAQQALMSGDAALFLIDKALSGTEDQRSAMVNLLRENPIMARNYVLLSLKRNRAQETDFRAYDFAIGRSDDPDYLNAFVSLPPEQRYQYEHKAIAPSGDCPPGSPAIPEGWSVSIDRCLSIPLPSVERFRSGALEFTAPFRELLRVHTLLVGARATYAWTQSGAGPVGVSEDISQRTREYAVISVLF